MPHVSSSGGDDLGSTDEVKVYKDEGIDEDEKRSSENLTEEKSSLIDLTESEEKSGNFNPSSKNAQRPDHSPVFGKVEPHTSFNMGYLVSPYSYANGGPGPIPVSMAGKMGLGPGGHLPAYFCPNGDPLSHQPPPAHMGIPPYQLSEAGKGAAAAGAMGEYAAAGGQAPPPPHQPHRPLSPAEWRRLGPLLAATGLTRPPMYPFSASQYPYPMLSPEMSAQVASWHTPSMYPLSPGAGFRSPYPSALAGPSDFYRFSPTGLIQPHPGLSPHAPHLGSHPAIVTPGPKQELPDINNRSQDHKNNVDGKNNQDNEKKKPHIKKPLNAFMLYMKEMRAKVVAECTLKESAAINQILGRRWHSLSREEQAKYYEKARLERQLHMQLYPGWSARDNYGYGTKKKKRKKERAPIESGGNSMKKCRARYGLDQQSQWCKPCRRKKKCIRYMESGGDSGNDGNQSDDNLGSCGSMGDANTPPDDDNESLNQSMSSPGGLSGLSSLTSPGGMVLPSPSTSVASPSVSAPSPYMLQSPLTPHHDSFDVKLPPPQLHLPSPHRNPVGTNPHDINNPLSVNQLTGQCVGNKDNGSKQQEAARSIISVT
ncbi:protein pangolin, isoforms A/H/I/S isoform X3 [Anthonomus grandis grandis]|uniref:protein pangolin, isoforms A/H/I/S isoform X3 n=1 Tax=Anthonomus grandis grandis TaxID=2921223 RepID=UPI0021662E3C|nr:protein pangolin, isoforms A/H/I/S isoform X3 [Anthonomus grandis grandis]